MLPISTLSFTNIKKPLVNNQIRTEKVRLIDDKGSQIGIVTTKEALERARAKELDLIMVTDKTEPPVCKIVDYGKYLYGLKKKERKPQKSGEIKGIRLTFNISSHDLETRAKQAKKFLSKGYKVRIEMRLHGREKGMADFARKKIEGFLSQLKAEIPFKEESSLKKQPRGLTMVISKETE